MTSIKLVILKLMSCKRV